MSLRNDLEQTMHEAMRKKDDLTRDTIRLVFSSIKQVEVETRKTLEDVDILSILQKEVKIRKETISELGESDRPDLVQKAKSEIAILEKFLPAQLSDMEITILANQVIQEVSAKNPADMGKVMKTLLPLVKGQAPSDRISRIVKQLLSN